MARKFTAESSKQILSPMTVLPSSLPNAGEDGLAIVNISTANILDKRSSLSGSSYKCELDPLWLAADENGLVRKLSQV
jgi:hypothetical protein